MNAARARRTLVAVLAVVLVSAPACAAPVVETVGDGPEWGWTRQELPLRLGVTHMQVSLAPGDPAAALARGRAVLAASGPLQAQHLMGFGVLNPEPSPGAYDWTSLDTRMRLIADTGGETVLTLAAAPDWMKGGAPGSTNWSRIEDAPFPAHYDDFAALCAAAVRRYPQVRHVQVWNELKGFYDAARNRWDVEAYAVLYDRVYRAVKAVRPDVAVGGPYIPLDAWANPAVAPSDVSGPWGVADQRSLDVLTYWLGHNPGADFLVVDGGDGTKDRGLLTTPTDAADRFAVLTRWLRARSPLPVWWAEFYPEIAEEGGPEDPQVGAASPRRAVATLEALAAFARSGASAAMLWQPQQSTDFPYAALWTDTAAPDGGRPTPLTTPWAWLAPRLHRGVVETGRSPDGRLLAFRDTRDGVELLVANTSADDVRVGATTVPAMSTAVLPR